MKQKLLNNFRLRAVMLVAMMCAAFTGAWADKVTDIANIVSGSRYYIGATVGDTDYYFYADGSAVANGVQGTSKSDKAEAAVLVFEGSGSTWTIKFDGTSNYLSLASSKANGKVNVVSDAANWALSNSSSGLIEMTINNYKLQKNSSSSLNFGSYASGQKNVWLEEYVDPAELEDCDLALTGATVALNFDLYNNASAQVINYTTSSTGFVTIDDNDYATFDIDEENMTITVTPTAVTLSAQTITVNQAADETYNSGAVNFTITITDSTPISAHTATFSVNGVTSTQEFNEGSDIIFPADPADVNGKTFVGWVAEAIDGTTNDAPTFVTSAKMGQSDITYYAMFAYANGSGTSEVVDEMNREWTGSTGTSYASWTGKTATSTAVYAGNSAGGNDAIQLRSNNSNSGIVTTTSGGKAKKVVITWNDNTAATRTVSIYGKNSAYAVASDLYSSATQGTLLGELDIDDASGLTSELTISEDIEYIGIRSKSSALYLDEVAITWSTGGGVSYSDYCTTVVAAAVARPTIEVAANPFTFSTTATITCETEGAAIKYSFDGENWNDYTDDLTITETTTLYAKAVKDENDSEVASVTITKNLAVPTVTIDATGITNTNVYDGKEAGSLAAAVTYNDAAVEGAAITWSGNNDEVATIDASTGAVTLVAAGTVTFTATFAGNDDYAEKTATYQMTVTNSDPNVPGTENNPYNVADAITFIGTLGSATSATEVYVSGIISQVDSYNSKYSSITYWISDDGTTEGQMEVYSGKGLNGEDFSAKEDLQVGDIVTVKGYVKMYNTTPEFDKNNELVSFERPVVPSITITPDTYEMDAKAGGGELPVVCANLADAPELKVIFVEADGVTPATYDWISAEINNNGNIDGQITANTGDARTAYFYVQGVDADNNVVKSNLVTFTQQAAATEPYIMVNTTEWNVDANGGSKTFGFDYENLGDNPTFEVAFFDQTGETEIECGWISYEFVGDKVTITASNNDENSARTAYFKVYAEVNKTKIYSNLVTINQEGYVAPVPATTYTRATSITAGKHYLIVGYNSKNNIYQAMGVQNNNNRGVVDVPTINEDQISITDEDVKEVVFYGPDANNLYTIFVVDEDENKTGYLYAASSSSNYMRTQGINNLDGKWTINFNEGEASIVAQGENTHKVMRFNSGSSLFSCYASATQSPIYLYEKDEDTPAATTESVTLNAYGYTTFATTSALDFLDAEAADYSAWRISEINGSAITFEQLTQHVAAGQGIFIKGTANATVDLNILPAGGATLGTDNLLVAITEATPVAAGEYYGLKGNTFVPVNAGTAPAGKALLPASNVSLNVKAYTFIFNDADGIQTIQTVSAEEAQAIFNLAGQRLPKAQKGINIINGKKVLVK